jgi:hypothetical protein
MAAKNVLFYDKPAAIWEKALPIRNGRLGAMIKGTTNTVVFLGCLQTHIARDHVLNLAR